MSLVEFLQLDYKGRIQATNHAVCIGSREESEHKILLYQLDSFYIEVYFQVHYNYITAVHGFDDMELLDPYLKKIQISLSY